MENKFVTLLITFHGFLRHNQALQLTATVFGSSSVNQQTTVFDLSHVLCELLPQLNLDR